MSCGPKYVVVRGWLPGVYNTSATCAKQTYGFSRGLSWKTKSCSEALNALKVHDIVDFYIESPCDTCGLGLIPEPSHKTQKPKNKMPIYTPPVNRGRNKIVWISDRPEDRSWLRAWGLDPNNQAQQVTEIEESELENSNNVTEDNEFTYQEVWQDDLNEESNVDEDVPNEESNVGEAVPEESNVDEAVPEESSVDEDVPEESNVGEGVPVESNVDEDVPVESNVLDDTSVPQHSSVLNSEPTQLGQNLSDTSKRNQESDSNEKEDYVSNVKKDSVSSIIESVSNLKEDSVSTSMFYAVFHLDGGTPQVALFTSKPQAKRFTNQEGKRCSKIFQCGVDKALSLCKNFCGVMEALCSVENS